MRTTTIIVINLSFLFVFNTQRCYASITFKCLESKQQMDNGSRCTIRNFRPPFPDKFNFAGVNTFKVRELRFIESNFAQIPQIALKMYERIETLDVEGAGLDGLRSGCFYYAAYLRTLIAPYNKISELEEFTFEGAEKLMWINVSHNAISDLHPNVFRNLSKLEVLDMKFNMITTLDKFIFIKQKRLRSVFLDNNQIIFLDPYIFYSTEALESVLLNDNYLDQLKLHLQNNHITYLYAMNNRIKNFYLDADNKDFEDHNFYIELKNNKLQTFYISSRLTPTYLSLPNNNLNYIGNITQLQGLTYLDLSYNKIQQITSTAFQNLTNLEELYLSGIGMSTMDDDYFANLKNMKRLVISDNEINEIEIEKLAIPKTIEELDLSRNNLSSFDIKHLTKSMPKLVRLDLSNNPLTIKKINELAIGNSNILIMNYNDNDQDDDDTHGQQLVERNISYVQQKLANLLMELHKFESNANYVNLSNYRRIENSENHLKVLNLFLIFLLIVVLCLFMFTIYVYVSIKTKST